jgi:hypothetical protein
MKTYGGRDIAPPFLNSALDEHEWSASQPCRFTPVETDTGTYYTEIVLQDYFISVTPQCRASGIDGLYARDHKSHMAACIRCVMRVTIRFKFLN